MLTAPPTLTLTRDVGPSVRAGHPWVFADVLRVPRSCAPGDVADLVDPRGEFVARGVVDPDSPLAFRAMTRQRSEAVDEALLGRRIDAALALRAAAVPPDVTGLRLVHGECDHLPGLQADRYGDVLSIRSDGRVGLAWEGRFVEALGTRIRPRAIVARNPHASDGQARTLAGDASALVEIREGDRRYLVDVVRGQKTGFFLDQRENRSLVARLAPGQRVLNLFAYTGGFSVAAALAGAREVHTVDVAPAAVDLARENFRLNGLPLQSHLFTEADAFDVLEAAATEPGRWDLIIVDPPSFASSRQTRSRALRAYGRLNRLALRALPPGGWLATATCSSHVDEASFLNMLADAARETGRLLTLATVAGAGPDHPVLPAFPEGRYLTFVLAHVA